MAEDLREIFRVGQIWEYRLEAVSGAVGNDRLGAIVAGDNHLCLGINVQEAWMLRYVLQDAHDARDLLSQGQEGEFKLY